MGVPDAARDRCPKATDSRLPSRETRTVRRHPSAEALSAGGVLPWHRLTAAVAHSRRRVMALLVILSLGPLAALGATAISISVSTVNQQQRDQLSSLAQAAESDLSARIQQVESVVAEVGLRPQLLDAIRGAPTSRRSQTLPGMLNGLLTHRGVISIAAAWYTASDGHIMASVGPQLPPDVDNSDAAWFRNARATVPGSAVSEGLDTSIWHNRRYLVTSTPVAVPSAGGVTTGVLAAAVDVDHIGHALAALLGGGDFALTLDDGHGNIVDPIDPANLQTGLPTASSDRAVASASMSELNWTVYVAEPTAAGLAYLDHLRTTVIVVGILLALVLGCGLMLTNVTLSALDASRRNNAQLAVTDGLTGLHNRRGFEQAISRLGDRAFAVIAIDMDNLKPINDRLGHAEGDRVLRELAERLRSSTRSWDLVARLGGDEFAVIVLDSTADDAAKIAERIRASSHTVTCAIRVSVSVGWAAGEPGSDAQLAWAAADECLYGAKRSGRDRVVGRVLHRVATSA